MRRLWMVLSFAMIAGVACGSDAVPQADSGEPAGVKVTGEFSVAVWASGFSGPTQMVFADNGDLIIAELNGSENDATGRVLRVDAQDRSNRSVLQDGLDKPTGVMVAGDRLWIMERRRLSVTTLEPGAALEIVADELPYNGRSEGTLTLTPEGQLLYDTSGSKRGAARVDGSGTLFSIENAAAGASESTVVAVGFKHAYAHVVDPDGQLWSLEMTDGNFDGERASDELLAVQPGDEAGWPQCVEDNRPVAEFGGTAELCAASPPSHALFGAGATPTSLVVAPWDPDLFLVTLWLSSQVVAVPRGAPADGPHTPAVLIEGIESPQHLLVDGDGVLLSDHETGQIFRVAAD